MFEAAEVAWYARLMPLRRSLPRGPRRAVEMGVEWPAYRAVTGTWDEAQHAALTGRYDHVRVEMQ